MWTLMLKTAVLLKARQYTAFCLMCFVFQQCLLYLLALMHSLAKWRPPRVRQVVFEATKNYNMNDYKQNIKDISTTLNTEKLILMAATKKSWDRG